MLIMVRTHGNAPPPSPMRAAQSHGRVLGSVMRPIQPPIWSTPKIQMSPLLPNARKVAGMARATGMPVAAQMPSMLAAAVEERPASA